MEAQLHSCHRLPMSPWENQLPSHHLHDHYDLPIQYQLLQKNIPLDSLGKGRCESRSWGVCALTAQLGETPAPHTQLSLAWWNPHACSHRSTQCHVPRLPGNIWLDDSGNRTLSLVITDDPPLALHSRASWERCRRYCVLVKYLWSGYSILASPSRHGVCSGNQARGSHESQPCKQKIS